MALKEQKKQNVFFVSADLAAPFEVCVSGVRAHAESSGPNLLFVRVFCSARLSSGFAFCSGLRSCLLINHKYHD